MSGPRSANPAQETAMAETRRLLVIDDEENMRHMLQSVLGRLGYAVRTA